MAILPTPNSTSQAYTSSVNVMNQFSTSLNIPEMGLLIQMERHNILQGQVQDQFKDMQNRNKWLQEATEALNLLRAKRPPNAEGNNSSASLTEIRFPETPDNVDVPPKDANNLGTPSQKLADYFNKNGIKMPKDGKGLNQTDFDTAIANLKASIDTVNTNSQLDMVRMQGLMDKMNQATDFMTNWVSKNTKTMDSIISNIR